MRTEEKTIGQVKAAIEDGNFGLLESKERMRALLAFPTIVLRSFATLLDEHEIEVAVAEFPALLLAWAPERAPAGLLEELLETSPDVVISQAPSAMSDEQVRELADAYWDDLLDAMPDRLVTLGLAEGCLDRMVEHVVMAAEDGVPDDHDRDGPLIQPEWFLLCSSDQWELLAVAAPKTVAYASWQDLDADVRLAFCRSDGRAVLKSHAASLSPEEHAAASASKALAAELAAASPRKVTLSPLAASQAFDVPAVGTGWSASG